MATFSGEDLSGAVFTDVDLRGARFTDVVLAGAVLRGVDVGGLEIDSPWLCEPGGTLFVNGVDVAPYVDAELDRRFPGRALRRARDPEGLRAVWEAVERTWAATQERVSAMPAGTVEASVAGEWSFAQTLRHLVHATDVWLGKAVLGREQPFHPMGLPFTGFAAAGGDTSPYTEADPSYAAVLEARADRVSMVREFLAGVTPEVLGESRANPHDPAVPETVLSCVGTILEEEWEHHRYAVRDLEALDGGADGRRPGASL